MVRHGILNLSCNTDNINNSMCNLGGVKMHGILLLEELIECMIRQPSTVALLTLG